MVGKKAPVETKWVMKLSLHAKYGKVEILVGENYDEFGDSLRICQSFACQLLVVSETARDWA